MGARSTYVLGPFERIVITGDSLVAGGISGVGGISVPWRDQLEPIINQTFNGTSPCKVQDLGRPTLYRIQGFSSTTMAQWSSGYAAQVLGQGCTLCFVAYGVNDALMAVAPATTAANLRTGVLGCWASEPGIKMVVVGPMNDGVQWPQGANAADAAIAATSAAMQAMCDTLSASGQITWIDPRTYWFSIVPTYNPTNVAGTGGLTVDGLHLNNVAAPLVANGAIWAQRVAS